MVKAANAATQWTTLDDMPFDEFEKRAMKAQSLTRDYTDAMRKLFPIPTLTSDERDVAPRMKNGEHAVFITTLDAADGRPETFKGLADADAGRDPKKLETDLLRDRIRKHKALSELATTLGPVSALLSDGPLDLATRFHEVCRAAYRLAKSLAMTDKSVKSKMATAIDYYSAIGKKGAATRAANKKAQAHTP